MIKKKLNLTEEEKAAFVNGASFGLSFAQMKQYLSIPPMEQKTYAFTGIPVDTSYVAATNELGLLDTSGTFSWTG
jgi:hypothetical protein